MKWLLLTWLVGCAGAIEPAVETPEVEEAPVAREGEWAIGGTSLHYRIVGSGTPIVLLHGGPGGNLGAFRALDELATNYQLIAYDQRGAGDSARLPIDPNAPDTSLISVERNVEDLEEIRELLGLEKLTLLGHSWGATLAVFYAARYPGHVERMIVYDGGPVWLALAEARQRAMRERMSEETRAAFQAGQAEIGANVSTWTQDELDAAFVHMGELFMETLVCEPSAGPVDLGRGGFWANVLSNAYEESFDIDAFLPSLAAVHAPVLLTHGRCEPTPIDRVTVLRDALPDAKLVVFPESGHQALEEQHDLFVQTVRAFLADEALPLPLYEGPGTGVAH